MTQFRKKPVVIEAVQFDDHAARYGWSDLILADNPWLDAAYDPGGSLTNYQGADGKQYIKIRTREGNMRCKVGDWIIRGVKGELYPCKPDIFEATYEPAATPEPTADRGWEVQIGVQTMKLSDGREEHYVYIRKGDREITPHKYDGCHMNRARYEVDELTWLLLDGPKPDIIDPKYDDPEPAISAIFTPAALTPTDKG